MSAQLARHGDVLLVPCYKTEGELISHKGQFPLAFGEVTGHSHRLTVKNPNNMKVFQTGTNLYIVLMEVGILTHEEHSTVEIQPGTYRRDMEREYSYIDMDMKQVID
jgi:hypothetical protein